MVRDQVLIRLILHMNRVAKSQSAKKSVWDKNRKNKNSAMYALSKKEIKFLFVTYNLSGKILDKAHTNS